MFFKLVVLGVVLSFGAACDRKADMSLETTEDQVSYAIGQQMGEQMQMQGFDINVSVLAQSIEDVLEGKESRLSQEEMEQAFQAMTEEMMAKQEAQAESAAQEGEEFLEQNAQQEDVEVTDSGLQYRVLEEGDGAQPGERDEVRVHYEGSLVDGTVFDSSIERGEPAEFPVQGVIPGWSEALQMMQEGDKWELTIPSELAYGEQGAGGQIPPNSVLIFKVELLEVL